MQIRNNKFDILTCIFPLQKTEMRTDGRWGRGFKGPTVLQNKCAATYCHFQWKSWAPFLKQVAMKATLLGWQLP